MPTEAQIRFLERNNSLRELDEDKLKLLFKLACNYRRPEIRKFGLKRPNEGEIQAIKGFIRDLREWLGVSQTRFGHFVGTSQHTISKWETPEASLPLKKHFDYILELYRKSFVKQIGRINR